MDFSQNLITGPLRRIHRKEMEHQKKLRLGTNTIPPWLPSPNFSHPHPTTKNKGISNLIFVGILWHPNCWVMKFLAKFSCQRSAWILLSRGHRTYLTPCERDRIIFQNTYLEKHHMSPLEESWVVGPNNSEASQFLKISRKWFRECHVINKVEPIDMINASMHFLKFLQFPFETPMLTWKTEDFYL